MKRLDRAKFYLTLLFIFTCFFLPRAMSVLAEEGGHGDKRPVKKGILLIAFGTSIPEAQGTFTNIEKKVKEAFPDVPVHWAYTSEIIRKKLAKQGQQLDSVAVALARMKDEDFTHVAVQSLHIIPGEEYHDLLRTVHAFRDMPDGIRKILVGYPLLGTTQDIQNVVNAMMAHFPQERKKEEAVILMGHGTHHPGNVFYPAIQYYFWKKDPNVFVGTVEGSPSLDDILQTLKEKNITTAYLMPFMAVAGDHARNDMAGDEEDSWKSVLTKAGIKPVAILKGAAEHDEVVSVWIEHLKGVMQHFQ